MLEGLRRHPFAVEARFRWSLVLTYALPKSVLAPLIGPGLELDTYGDDGFLAIALVQTEALRPRGAPAFMGRDFFLSGYRIFTRFARPGRQALRGLRILRSDTDRASMVTLGNLFTHYRYRRARVAIAKQEGRLEIEIATPDREADLRVSADLTTAAGVPEGSPFESLAAARAFAGPLPYTFSFDDRTQKMVVVRGLRKAWDPRPVSVSVSQATYLEREPFASAGARLANAFFVEDVPYAWKAGSLEPLE
jgi:uncharacterized protein YqjF (DUF2071 family)